MVAVETKTMTTMTTVTDADHLRALSAIAVAGWKGEPTAIRTMRGSGVEIKGLFTLQGEAFEIVVDSLLVAARSTQTTITYQVRGETRVDTHPASPVVLRTR